MSTVKFTLAVLAATVGLIAAPVDAAIKKKAKVGAVAAAAVALPVADAAQMDVASRVLVGGYECEFGKTADVTASAKHAGYVDLKVGKSNWLMKPVQSDTGAIRLEDVKGQTRVIQIANKSMLFNIKSGQRILDGCVHAAQKQAAAAAAN